MVRIFNRDRHENSDAYFDYEARVTNGHLIPLFRDVGVPLDRPILDVGCCFGGCSITMAESLDVPIVGIDINQNYIETASRISKERGINARFDIADVLTDKIQGGPYGLILMHDVIEHLPTPEIALARLLPLVDNDGFLYVSFPPWLSPYAGHQHNVESKVKFMPYLHALSPSLFLKLINRWEPRGEEWVEELTPIVENSLTMRKFEGLAERAGWKIVRKETYLLRPEFIRMGLPKIPNYWFGKIPWLGECFTTGCEYLLSPR